MTNPALLTTEQNDFFYEELDSILHYWMDTLEQCYLPDARDALLRAYQEGELVMAEDSVPTHKQQETIFRQGPDAFRKQGRDQVAPLLLLELMLAVRDAYHGYAFLVELGKPQITDLVELNINKTLSDDLLGCYIGRLSLSQFGATHYELSEWPYQPLFDSPEQRLEQTSRGVIH